jgi:hypothetical protein
MLGASNYELGASNYELGATNYELGASSVGYSIVHFAESGIYYTFVKH